MSTMKRDQNDSRLPNISPIPWGLEVVPRGSWNIIASDGYGVTGIPFDEQYGDDADAGNAKVIAAAPDLLACVFGLMVNFPELQEGVVDDPYWWDRTNGLTVVAWLRDQAPYWRAALEKAGVEL